MALYSPEQFASEMLRTWLPPRRLKLSEWMEEHFRLSSDYSAATGAVKLYRYQREPLDAFTDETVREIVIKSATQMLKTFVLQGCIAYSIAEDPCPILLGRVSDDDAEQFSKERIAPMLRDIDVLRAVVMPDTRGPGSGSTILHKTFRGGSLSIVGAQSPKNFAARSIRVLLGDEVNKWPRSVGKEGDPWSLGVKRTATFRSRAKLVRVCSPTIEGSCTITEAYDASDQRKFFTPCVRCGCLQVLTWDRVRWDNRDALSARYQCIECDREWNDAERWSANESDEAEWRAAEPFAGIAGFWISELYSPWKKLSDIVADFLSKKDNPATFQTFVNTSLAECWRDKGEAPDHEKLIGRASTDYQLGEVPAGVAFLVASTDAQKDRLERAVWGFGARRQRYLIDYEVIYGDTSREDVWNQLTERCLIEYARRDGASVPVMLNVIDSGYATAEVYRWAARCGLGPGRVMVAKGYDSGASLVGTPSAAEIDVRGKKVKAGVHLWPINVSMAKQALYGALRAEKTEDGGLPVNWVHIPRDGWLNPTLEEFCRQITAEEYVITQKKNGFTKGEWVKVRDRNEALDTANLAYAGAEHLGWSRMADEAADRIAAAPQQGPPQAAQREPEQHQQARSQPRGNGGFFGPREGWFSR